MFWRADTPDGATPEEQSRALRDVALAKRIGEHLERVYPGHFFRTQVDSRGGLISISHPLLPQGWAYQLKLSRLAVDPGMTCITKAGGELLERFYLPRSRWKSDLWEAASQKYTRIKHGLLTQHNFKTGERKFVLPTELAAR